ncbi:rhomboid family intramembrane serine protease [Mucilaginibacter sp.]|uniref:rhomboid family intramembrane serine protease n=1 Tax=Mucilaginibacter sp. TaxID=1882438 RepID=UPI003D0E7E55
MAWGISPYKTAVIPLGDYNADHYLTLLYHAFANLGWHTGYFDREGIIAYTNISWASYAEEVSVRIVNNEVIIKSECIGYQFFFYDYGKNQKNLDLLYNEIPYVEYHLQLNLEQTTQQLIDSIPENQFLTLANPPMGAKETLHTFFSPFIPTKNYLITPLLVFVNIAVFMVTMLLLWIMMAIVLAKHNGDASQSIEGVYLSLGFSDRTQVLNGQVWRLLTNTFLHFSLLHLTGNMIVLIYIGSMLECKLGKWNYLFLYLFAGVCASLTSVIWNTHMISGGASGPIFGLFGILLALLSTNFYERNARRALLISTAIFVGFNIIPFGKHIDDAAHFGGLIAGYIMGWIAYLGIKYNKQSLISVSTLAITVLFMGLCLRYAHTYNFKELNRLLVKERVELDSLNDNFYGQQNSALSHADRISILEHRALPRLKTLKDIAQKLTQVPLPDKQTQIAKFHSKILLQECMMFNLLYKEAHDQDNIKYRPAINKLTDNINQLRCEWGKLDDGNNGY